MIKINYFYDDELTTKIQAEPQTRKVWIKNYTEILPHRAFGIKECPTWRDFEDFLENRCFPKTRANASEILQELGLNAYDPLEICKRTNGRMAEDHSWMEIDDDSDKHPPLMDTLKMIHDEYDEAF